ncbi:uncharacterized protein LAJ45_11654 [Morchella importuna]|uniref:uncharacterized protein n=1 Tax=Morchella importuna TaxID=1174673 RepID=UPI001E8DCD02|nr:uncharacterized protein LAJ45_11654 [Morchella importuna]KAH8144365.1 hypothetical protein LAJ45_11654 [Morchella importuna]
MANTMLTRSPLASYSFTDSSGANIRVCYQNRDGVIGMTGYDDKKGWRNSGKELRLYTVRSDGAIAERCYSGGEWYDGELTGVFVAAKYSQLAAAAFETSNGTISIRVYYQDPDNKIHEACRDGSEPWFDGNIFETAIAATSIAVSQIPGREWYLWLFFQRPNTEFVEWLMQASSSWKQGVFKSQATYDPGAYISCASYGRDDHRGFTVDRENKLCVTEFNAGSNNWQPTKQLGPVIPQSALAAVPVPGNVPWVRIYVQTSPGQIAEWGTNDGKNYSLMASQLPTN